MSHEDHAPSMAAKGNYYSIHNFTILACKRQWTTVIMYPCACVHRFGVSIWCTQKSAVWAVKAAVCPSAADSWGFWRVLLRLSQWLRSMQLSQQQSKKEVKRGHLAATPRIRALVCISNHISSLLPQLLQNGMVLNDNLHGCSTNRPSRRTQDPYTSLDLVK